MDDLVTNRLAFLCELREHGDVDRACTEIGWNKADFIRSCDADPHFDRTQTEVYLEYIEETLMAEARKRLGRIRLSELQALAVRHG